MMVLKKKTIIILTLVLLIVAAGYVSTKYGRALRVDNNVGTEAGQTTDDDAITSNNNETASGYFIDVRLGRENTRSLEKQTLTELINNEKTTTTGRKDAEKKLMNIVDLSEVEMRIEAVIKAKGFTDALVFLSDDSANVTIRAKELKSDEVSVIKNIVCRESELPAASVTIQAKE